MFRHKGFHFKDDFAYTTSSWNSVERNLFAHTLTQKYHVCTKKIILFQNLKIDDRHYFKKKCEQFTVQYIEKSTKLSGRI